MMMVRLWLMTALPFFVFFSSPAEGAGKLTGKPLSSVDSQRAGQISTIQGLANRDSDLHANFVLAGGNDQQRTGQSGHLVSDNAAGKKGDSNTRHPSSKDGHNTGVASDDGTEQAAKQGRVGGKANEGYVANSSDSQGGDYGPAGGGSGGQGDSSMGGGGQGDHVARGAGGGGGGKGGGSDRPTVLHSVDDDTTEVSMDDLGPPDVSQGGHGIELGDDDFGDHEGDISLGDSGEDTGGVKDPPRGGGHHPMMNIPEPGTWLILGSLLLLATLLMAKRTEKAKRT